MADPRHGPDGGADTDDGTTIWPTRKKIVAAVSAAPSSAVIAGGVFGGIAIVAVVVLVARGCSGAGGAPRVASPAYGKFGIGPPSESESDSEDDYMAPAVRLDPAEFEEGEDEEWKLPRTPRSTTRV